MTKKKLVKNTHVFLMVNTFLSVTLEILAPQKSPAKYCISLTARVNICRAEFSALSSC